MKFAPRKCDFHTYDPYLVALRTFRDVATCKHTIPTLDSYPSIDGRNWGVKVSTETLFPNYFEIGVVVAAVSVAAEHFGCSLSERI